jgi:hypothetical protein
MLSVPAFCVEIVALTVFYLVLNMVALFACMMACVPWCAVLNCEAIVRLGMK